MDLINTQSYKEAHYLSSRRPTEPTSIILHFKGYLTKRVLARSAEDRYQECIMRNILVWETSPDSPSASVGVRYQRGEGRNRGTLKERLHYYTACLWVTVKEKGNGWPTLTEHFNGGLHQLVYGCRLFQCPSLHPWPLNVLHCNDTWKSGEWGVIHAERIMQNT